MEKEGDQLAKKHKINVSLKNFKKQAIDLNNLKDKDFDFLIMLKYLSIKEFNLNTRYSN